MSDLTDRCSECDHPKKAHKLEPGFYDVPTMYAECGYVGCPCKRYRVRWLT